MRMSKSLQKSTLKDQRAELVDAEDELREIVLCLSGCGLTQTSDKIDGQLERIRDACRKIKAVIEDMEDS